MVRTSNNSKLHLTLYRVNDSDQGTLGILMHDKTLLCWTIEKPWRDNEPFKSCIPTGTYDVIGMWIQKVPGRYGILFHAGNWAGDEDMGFRSDSEGCILPGVEPLELLNQKAITHSKRAFKSIGKYTEGKPFALTIRNTL